MYRRWIPRERTIFDKGRSGYTFYTRENQNNFKKIIKEEK